MRTLNPQPSTTDHMRGKENLEILSMHDFERAMEDEMRARDDKKMRQDTLKCIKGKTLSEAKELVFTIKYEMPANCFRKLH